jgi:pyruvate formate lyase activating enzyme
VRSTLDRRRGLLDGVVFSGGEPLRQAAVVDAIAEVREMDFLAAIHTAGGYPSRFEALLPSLAWVGLDIKAPRRKYEAITGVEVSGDRAWASLELLVASGVDYELRVTVDPTVLSLADVKEVVRDLEAVGARTPVLQEARPDGTTARYAQALGSKRLRDIVPDDELPHVPRRFAHDEHPATSTVREAIAGREATIDWDAYPPV